jgi:hypothetical protein
MTEFWHVLCSRVTALCSLMHKQPSFNSYVMHMFIVLMIALSASVGNCSNAGLQVRRKHQQ